MTVAKLHLAPLETVAPTEAPRGHGSEHAACPDCGKLCTAGGVVTCPPCHATMTAQRLFFCAHCHHVVVWDHPIGVNDELVEDHVVEKFDLVTRGRDVEQMLQMYPQMREVEQS